MDMFPLRTWPDAIDLVYPRKDFTKFYVALASKVPLKHVASALDREEDNEPVTQAGGPVSYQMLQIVDNVSMYEKVWIYVIYPQTNHKISSNSNMLETDLPHGNVSSAQLASWALQLAGNV